MEELENLERRIPIASDKALINLVNGIQISRDLINYQKSRGWFGIFFDEIAGTDRKRQILLGGNLIEGQQALYDWVMELTNSLKVSQTALVLTQNSLLEARLAIRRQKESLSTQKQDLTILDDKLGELSQKIGNQLSIMEDRIVTLELNVEAQKDFEQIVTTWEARRTYTGLPWIIQVVMLIREVFSSTIVAYELQTNDTLTYRKQLVNRILSASEITHKKFFSLSELLDLMLQEARSLDDLELSLGILETRTLPYPRVQKLPFLFTMTTTLELAVLAEDIRPFKPAHCAVELCRDRVQEIDYTTTTSDLITSIIHETANNSLFLAAHNVTT